MKRVQSSAPPNPSRDEDEDMFADAAAARKRLAEVIKSADKTLVDIDAVLRDVAEVVKSDAD